MIGQADGMRIRSAGLLGLVYVGWILLPVQQRVAYAADADAYRASDTRPRHDDRKLSRIGIHKYESKHLRLYSDIDPKLAESLPPLMDLAYSAWEAYFGRLPPNRERTVFQMTGYIMRDKELFRRHGLLRAEVPGFLHGTLLGAEFWMVEQEYPYYLRHLMIHEGTHCFMLALPGLDAPVWYLEGMAELFGTHWVDPSGKVLFRVMPHDRKLFVGHGRIRMIQQDVLSNGYRPLSKLTGTPTQEFVKTLSYAWAWALCQFLDSHPRYRDRFHRIGRQLVNTDFDRMFQAEFDEDLRQLWAEWPVFATNVIEAYDFDRSAIEFRSGRPLGAARSQIVRIAAARGWQSSGVLVQKGRSYRVTAAGQFTLSQEPKPWVSEATGISFRFYAGKPLGLLLAAVDAVDAQSAARPDESGSLAQTIPIGRSRQFTAQSSGTLYFRLNDFLSELADNRGQVEVTIRATD